MIDRLLLTGLWDEEKRQHYSAARLVRKLDERPRMLVATLMFTEDIPVLEARANLDVGVHGPSGWNPGYSWVTVHRNDVARAV